MEWGIGNREHELGFRAFVEWTDYDARAVFAEEVRIATSVASQKSQSS